MYLAHLKTIMLESFDNSSYYDSALVMQTTIKASVQADDNKFFTYSEFIQNITTDVTSGMGPTSSTTPGITNLMDARNAYLLALSDFTNEAPAISDIELSESIPEVGTSVTISATVTDPTAVYLGYRNDTELPFTRIQMDSDGSDGVYSTSILVDKTSIEYYIYAENDDAGMFSPDKAEHEYYEITATISEGTTDGVVINEFMASNETTEADQDDEYDDWIELYNNSSETVDLGGYFLSDDADDLMQWEIPEGTSIGANAYLTIWADKDEEQTGLHASFKISASSGSLFIVDSEGSTIDQVSYTKQTTDISYGRYPNGTGDFQSMSPTFNTENTIASSIVNTQVNTDILVYPNPSSDYFHLKIQDTNTTENEVTIYNTMGQIVYYDCISQETTINVSQWENGIYMVKIGSSIVKLMVLK
jgi:hypothetical protein